MADDQELCLRWNRFSDHIAEAFESLFVQQRLLDVTLCCEGRNLQAHRVVLSACSPIFETLLTTTTSASHPNPHLIFTDILYEDLSLLIEFMYRGNITVKQSLLPRVLQTAENLRIHGLCQHNARYDSGERLGFDEEVSSSPDSCVSNVTTGLLDLRALEPTVSHEMSAVSSQTTSSIGAQPLTTAAITAADQGRSSAPRKSETVCLASSIEDERNFRNRSKMSQHTPRLRVFWRRGHVAQLESWYKRNRYPNVQQAQEYAMSLARLFPDGPMPTTQNVANWFQNRRRRDNHPDVQEKRDKKRNSKQRKENTESEIDERHLPTGSHSVLGRMLETLDDEISDSEQNMEESTAQDEELDNEDSKISMDDHSDEGTFNELQDLSFKSGRHRRD